MNEFKEGLKVSEEELYRQHNYERNKRVYKKFGKDYKEQKRKREQKELHDDILEELGLR